MKTQISSRLPAKYSLVSALRESGLKERDPAAPLLVDLGAADGATAHDLDRIECQRVKREDALDAFAEADLADGEAGADALVGAGDADAFEVFEVATRIFDAGDDPAELRLVVARAIPAAAG